MSDTETTEVPAPRPRPARFVTDPMAGAMFELTRHPGLHSTGRVIYLALASRPGLDQQLVADVAGCTVRTVSRLERELCTWGLLAEDRTVLYPVTGREE